MRDQNLVSRCSRIDHPRAGEAKRCLIPEAWPLAPELHKPHVGALIGRRGGWSPPGLAAVFISGEAGRAAWRIGHLEVGRLTVGDAGAHVLWWAIDRSASQAGPR